MRGGVNITYTYRCKNEVCPIGEFTIEQGIKDSILTCCPTCGGKIVQVYKSVGIIVNTDGFCGKINNK